MADLKARVKEALDNAKDNGYDFSEYSAVGLAEDLVLYSSDLEDEDVDVIANIIKELNVGVIK